MRRNVSTLSLLSALTLAAGLLLAPVASAMSGSGSLRANTPRTVSTLKLNVVSLATESTLPAGMTLTLQKGFSSLAPGAAASLCTPAEMFDNLCPSASMVGTGSETVTPHQGLLGATGSISVGLSFYLGAAQLPGCAATVDVVMQLVHNVSDELLNWAPGHGIGNLCAHRGGVRLSFPSLPTYAYVSDNTPMTVNALSISLGSAAGAVAGLWRNPASCPKSGKWTGSLAFAFSSAGLQLPFTLACSAR
ncbi:MAG: hypothetical protein ACLP22_25880 [Solirubrobacteraceae bacterium]